MLHNVNVKREDQKPIKDFILEWKDDEDRAEDERKAYEALPRMPDGTVVTEQMWYAMCWKAFSDAGGMDPNKVVVQ